MNSRIVVVGLGGIGSWLLQGLCPFLNYQVVHKNTLVLVDGDKYEESNHTRQVFDELGPKAEVQAKWIFSKFPQLSIQAETKYISADGANDTIAIDEVIKTKDIVFSCVDNHKTRKLLSKHCSSLDDIVLISGGNDYTDGNVQIFIRKEGESLTPTIEKYHPEVAKPKDKSPFEMSCEEAAVSSPQLIFANIMAASIMLNAFYSLDVMDLEQSEIYFDIVQNAVVRRTRKK